MNEKRGLPPMTPLQSKKPPKHEINKIDCTVGSDETEDANKDLTHNTPSKVDIIDAIGLIAVALILLIISMIVISATSLSTTRSPIIYLIPTLLAIAYIAKFIFYGKMNPHAKPKIRG